MLVCTNYIRKQSFVNVGKQRLVIYDFFGLRFLVYLNFLKNTIINGIETKPDKIFAIGWHNSNPVRFKNLGKIKINGRKNTP